MRASFAPAVSLSPVTVAVLSLFAFSCDAPERRSKPTSVTVEPDEPPLARRGTDETALEYTIGLQNAHKHLVDVELTATTAGQSSIELVLATWTPGSYLIREYARHIEGLGAISENGDALGVTKIRKNRWRVETTGASTVTVRYRVYARELSVRTNFVDDEVASIVGAATFLTIEGRQKQPHDVAIAIRPGWARSVTGLDPHPSGTPHRYLARDYDELVDSPIVIGNPVETTFEEAGVPHRIASFGANDSWDAKKANEDVAKIVREQQAFWGVVPYRGYVIQNLMLSGGGMGGLEHLDSTLLLANRWTMSKPARYRSWLGLVSHEVFHTWNGKRLRPESLGPFDYENEVHTRDLWIVEGLTSYYDDLMLARTGLFSEKQYLSALGGQIASLQRTHGRLVQPLSLASYDAWIKYYRSDENSSNTSISYYTKGAVVGFLLDMTIRRATGGKRSLDDVMRRAMSLYSGERGFTTEAFRQLCSEVAGTNLDEFFRRAIDTTEELDYTRALELVGLRFKPVEDDKDDEKAPYLGIKLSSRDTVTRVPRASPAFEAGLNVEDEILALAGQRLTGGLEEALKRHKVGDEIDILVSRRGSIRTFRATLAKPLAKAYVLEKMPNRSTSQAARAAEWLAPVAR